MEKSQAGEVQSVSRSATHSFSKQPIRTITLIAGLGVEGDAHMGKTVKHRSRVAKDPNQPNLRQVHLMHAELFDELKDAGFLVRSGQLGENITICGIDLLALPARTILHIGEQVAIEVTGLRNPCGQINRLQPGLLKELLDHDEHGNLVRKAGIMAIVLTGGDVRVGDPVRVKMPRKPHQPLQPV